MNSDHLLYKFFQRYEMYLYACILCNVQYLNLYGINIFVNVKQLNDIFLIN